MFLVSVASFILWCIKWYHLKTSKINYEFPAAQLTPLAAHDLAIKPNSIDMGYIYFIFVWEVIVLPLHSLRKQIKAFGSIWICVWETMSERKKKKIAIQEAPLLCFTY